MYQWGEIAIPTAGDTTPFNVVFPVAFNEGCYFLSAIYRFDAVFATEMERTKTGFYDSNINDIPDDSVEISDEYHAELLEKQSNGLVIESDENGYPIAVEHVLTVDVSQVNLDDVNLIFPELPKKAP